MSFTLGGWAVITCPCGVVYSVKFNIRAESPRDYADLLLSWKHVPNVTVYDYPRGLASHANHRSKKLFHPFEGRLLHPSEENIKKASENDLEVSLPWLNHRKDQLIKMVTLLLVHVTIMFYVMCSIRTIVRILRIP